MEVECPDEAVRCEHCACGAIKSRIQILDNYVLMGDRYVHVCFVCYDTRMERGLLLGRELNDDNAPVMPSSVCVSRCTSPSSAT